MGSGSDRTVGRIYFVRDDVSARLGGGSVVDVRRSIELPRQCRCGEGRGRDESGDVGLVALRRRVPIEAGQSVLVSERPATRDHGRSSCENCSVPGVSWPLGVIPIDCTLLPPSAPTRWCS